MMLATNFSAEKLLLGSSVAGLLDTKGQVVKEIQEFSPAIYNLVTSKVSSGGLGGMIPKLNSASLATRFGTDTLIFNAKKPQAIFDALTGKTGTLCRAQNKTTSAHQRWLGASSLAMGRIVVDSGAAKAVKKRKSLLSVGITSVDGSFPYNSTVELWEEGSDRAFAIAQTSEDSGNITIKMAQKQSIEVAHADKIVLL